ncbi:MAG TPA: hypothetical protein VFH97_06360 [Gemmatimonadales bacterium]|nr:hypothetical protein [Gemmatimonadales bacterium]
MARTRKSPRWPLALSLAVLAAACAHRTAEAPPVVPGLDLRLPVTGGPDTIVYARSVTSADGGSTRAGTRTVVLRVVGTGGRARLLEVVQRFPGGGGEIVDTALAELGTLRAVEHESHQPARTMRFRFGPADVAGTVAVRGPAGDSVAQVRQSLGSPIFDSNIIDLVIAALPLRSGFSAELPFFIYELGGLVPMQVAVEERRTLAFAAVGRREAWVVTVAVPGAPATVWVDTRTRAVLRVRYDIPARGTSFTDDRMTPLTA